MVSVKPGGRYLFCEECEEQQGAEDLDNITPQ